MAGVGRGWDLELISRVLVGSADWMVVSFTEAGRQRERKAFRERW